MYDKILETTGTWGGIANVGPEGEAKEVETVGQLFDFKVKSLLLNDLRLP